MPTIDIIRTLITYNYALYDRVWASINHLTDEQFVQPIDYAHGSIRNQIVHVAVVDERWLKGLKSEPDARTFTLAPAAYATRVSARALWDSTAQAVIDYVTNLTGADLERQLPGMLGPTWQILTHLVNHGTDHRAQILRALHDFGAPTFDQDLIIYLWQM